MGRKKEKKKANVKEAQSSDMVHCSHFKYDVIRLHEIHAQMITSKTEASCDLCPEDQKKKCVKNTKKGRLGAGNVQSKGEKRMDIWVCLSCGHRHCAEDGALTKSPSHAKMHANQKKHCWAAQYSNPTVGFCFICNREMALSTNGSLTLVDGIPFSEAAACDRSRGANVVKGLQGENSIFNALLQNILAIYDMRVNVLHPDGLWNGPLINALRKLFLKTDATSDAGQTLNTSANMLFFQINDDTVQDSKSFLCSFLEKLCQEEKMFAPSAKETIVDYIFGGQVCTVYTGECSHTEVVNDNFYVIPVLFQEKRRPGVKQLVAFHLVEVEDCLHFFSEGGGLREQWVCEKCSEQQSNVRKNSACDGQDCESKGKEHKTKVYRSSERKILISKAPRILVIHLRKMEPTTNLAKLMITEQLDPLPYMDALSSQDHCDIKYLLIGVAMERNNRFTAYVRNGTLESEQNPFFDWIQVVDNDVRRTMMPTYSEGESTVLFYERVNRGVRLMDRTEDKKMMKPVEMTDETKSVKLNEEMAKQPVNGGEQCKASSPPSLIASLDDIDKDDQMVTPVEMPDNKETVKQPPVKVSEGEQWKEPAPPDVMDKEDQMVTRGDGYMIRGLQNLGYTCYLNSVLQAFFALGSIRKKLLGADIGLGELGDIFKAFLSMSAAGRTNCSIAPSRILRYFQSKFSQYKGCQEHDALEFFNRVCECLVNDETEEGGSSSGAMKFEKILYGWYLDMTIKQGCDHNTSYDEPSCVLPLIIPSKFLDVKFNEVDGSLSVHSLLNDYFTKNHLDEEKVPCEDCKMHRPMKKFMRISSSPPVFTVALKRMAHRGVGGVEIKVKGHVSFDEVFDLRPFIDTRFVQDNENTTYRLVSVVEHHGDAFQGHYTAFVRSSKMGAVEKWFLTNDTYVREVTLDDVLACEAYLLFYEKVNEGEHCMDSKEVAVCQTPLDPSIQGDDSWTLQSTKKKKKKPELAIKSNIPFKHAKNEPPRVELMKQVKQVNQELLSPVMKPVIDEDALTDRYVIRGLKNLGLTCYFNVVLQNLLALDTLRRKLLGPDVCTGGLANHLKFLFSETSGMKKGTLDPSKLFTFVQSEFPKYMKHQEHDCQEFFNQVCKRLIDDEPEARMARQGASSESITFADIFNIGISVNNLKIGCEHMMVTFQQYSNLLLPVPSKAVDEMSEEVDNSKGIVSVESCLKEYTKSELIPDVYCDDCKAMKHGNKQNLLSNAPQVLTLTLTRMKSAHGKVRKVMGHVRFGELLDLRPFMDPSSKEIATYRLVGIVEHCGDEENGNCVAYVRSWKMGVQNKRSPSKSWYLASDAYVKELNLKSVLGCEAYMLFYEKVNEGEPLPRSLEARTELEANRNLKKSKTPATSYEKKSEHTKHDPIAAPITEKFSTVDKKGKIKYSSVLMLDQGKTLEQDFRKFLKEFKVDGVGRRYYRHYFKHIITSGSSSYVIRVPFSFIMQYSKNLAKKVCKLYKMSKKILAKAARKFLSKFTELRPKLRLKFLELPVSYETLDEYLDEIDVVKEMPVFGEASESIGLPTPDALVMLQRILSQMIRNHRSGLSWNGKFTIGDVDVFSRKIFVISKKPQRFKDPDELKKAWQNDFDRYILLFLAKFQSCPYAVPYLHEFIDALKDVVDSENLEASYEFILHHPFLKPSLVRAFLLSGIHNACRSYDSDDTTVNFKVLLSAVVEHWQRLIQGVKKNQMLVDVLEFRDKNKNLDAETLKKGQAPVLNLPRDVGSGDAETLEKEKYADTLDSLVAYLRNVFEHGRDHTKEKRDVAVLEGHDRRIVQYSEKPRKQFMKTLEETEVAGAIRLGEYVCTVVFTLLSRGGMQGMLGPIWMTYKNYGSSPTGDSDHENWQLMDDDDSDDSDDPVDSSCSDSTDKDSDDEQ